MTMTDQIGDPAFREGMNTVPQSDWLTAGEAAAYLKVRTRSLLLWVRQGKVTAYALSGTKRRVWRFRKEDLDSLLFANVVSSASLTVLNERRKQ
jgi:excisionase family DNA binding protein